jgi:hemoglobin
MEVRSLYERVGGEPFFFELVDRFYDGVADDPVLRPMYPEDLSESRTHLALFLIQYWGGPRTYQEERGHPRLRMRHAPHRIDDVARDAWLAHMGAALSAMELSDHDRDELSSYLEMAAQQLRNA